jgi:phage baseplate assembly protein W
MATSPSPNKILYSDFFINLDMHPVSRDAASRNNENAIKESMRNLLMTDAGERPFQPKLGGNIRAMLFEHITPQTMISMREQIRECLIQYEPRANLIDVIVNPDYDRNHVNVTIVFNVINRQEPISLDVIITRVR